MKDPEYREAAEPGTTTTFVCSVCGSIVATGYRSHHTAWHREQSNVKTAVQELNPGAAL